MPHSERRSAFGEERLWNLERRQGEHLDVIPPYHDLSSFRYPCPCPYLYPDLYPVDPYPFYDHLCPYLSYHLYLYPSYKNRLSYIHLFSHLLDLLGHRTDPAGLHLF